MSAYEKRLFHWAEIHAYGLELHRSLRDEVPWPQVRMEELLDPRTGRLAELLRFLGLPPRDGPLTAVHTRVDRFREQTDLPIEREEIRRHSAFLELTAALGYDVEGVSGNKIAKRYRRS